MEGRRNTAIFQGLEVETDWRAGLRHGETPSGLSDARRLGRSCGTGAHDARIIRPCDCTTVTRSCQSPASMVATPDGLSRGANVGSVSWLARLSRPTMPSVAPLDGRSPEAKPMKFSCCRSFLLLLSWGLFAAVASADVGDPQVRTD